MIKAKHSLAILVCLIALAVLIDCQQPQGQRGKNAQGNRQQNNRQQNARANQNQNNRKQREAKASQAMEQLQRLKKEDKTKIPKNDNQKLVVKNQTKEVKNQKNLSDKTNQNLLISNNSQIRVEDQEPTSLKIQNLQSEEEIHQRADNKRQSLIKLMFLIVLGLIIIIMILLIKPYLYRTKTQPIPSQNTENPAPSNQTPPFDFQTFGENDSRIQRIIIKEKQTKIEIIKDRFLKKQSNKYGQNIISMTKAQEQSKVGTPTFAEGSAHVQM